MCVHACVCQVLENIRAELPFTASHSWRVHAEVVAFKDYLFFPANPYIKAILSVIIKGTAIYMFLQMCSIPRKVPLVNSGRGIPSHMSWSVERKTPSSSSSLSKLSPTGFDSRLPLAKSEARLLSWCSGNENQLSAHSAIAWESPSGTLNRIVFINSQ